MSAAARTYALLLRAYPAEFRLAYGREMTLVFREQRHKERVSEAVFWMTVVWDVMRSAPALRLESWHRRWATHTRTGEETTMKMTMAILAMMVGAMEAMNATQEVWVNGTLNHGWPLLGGTIGVVAGALLLSAGIALLRRSPNSGALAQAAAITCLLVFLLTGVIVPQM